MEHESPVLFAGGSLFPPLAHPPLLDAWAWWGALCVIGLALLAGSGLPPWRGRRGMDDWLARGAAGLALVAAATLAAGQVEGLLLRSGLWSLAGALGWLVLAVSSFRSRRPAALRRIYGATASAGGLLLAAWLVVMLAPAFGPSLNYDALEYHVGIIPQVFEAGRFEPIPHMMYTRQPIATEALYTLAAAIEGRPWGWAPGALHWLLLAFGGLTIVRLARRLGVPAVWRPWLALALLAHPVLFILQLDRMTDWTGVALLAAGLLALRRPVRTGGALLAGVIAGGAVAAKWTHAGTVALPLGLVALAGARRFGARGLLIFAAAALATWLPWGLWSWHHAGNPFSPFLASLFPTPHWPPERLAFLLGTHEPLSPLAAEYWLNLAGRLTGGVAGAWLAALALAGAAVAAMAAAGRRRIAPQTRMALALAAGVLVALLLWGQLRHAADRFLAPTLLAALLTLALLAARLLRRLPASARRGGRLAGTLALAVLALPAFVSFNELSPRFFSAARGFAPTALGRVAPEEHWQLGLGATSALFEAANALPAGSRLIALNEARRYPFRHPVALASVFDASPLAPHVRGATDGEQIRRRLRATGFTHLLVNEFEQARILEIHPPPRLERDPERLALVRAGDRAGLVERFRGETEFALDPPTPAERAAYLEFLALMRARASWSLGATPAFWIAPLEGEFDLTSAR